MTTKIHAALLVAAALSVAATTADAHNLAGMKSLFQVPTGQGSQSTNVGKTCGTENCNPLCTIVVSHLPWRPGGTVCPFPRTVIHGWGL